MDKTTFDYSLKNIPLPSRNTYLNRLMASVEATIKRMRWKAYFFLNPHDKTDVTNFRISTKKCPPSNVLLEPFEDELFKMVENIQFKKVSNAFQNKLNQDIKKINASNKVFTFADKSRNLYQLEKHNYEKLLTENITSNYKLAPENSADVINANIKPIASSLGIADRLETMNKRNAFITLKDHKENFQNRPKCRLINPTKSNLGIVSKNILENVNNTIRSLTNARQWRNTEAVINGSRT